MMAQARIRVSSYREIGKEKKTPISAVASFFQLRKRAEILYNQGKSRRHKPSRFGSQRKGPADKEMLPQEFVFSADFASLKIFIAISLSMMQTASKQASTLPYPLPGRSCLDVKDLPTSS